MVGYNDIIRNGFHTVVVEYFYKLRYISTLYLLYNNDVVY